MAIIKSEEVIAVYTEETRRLLCLDCTNLKELPDEPVRFFEERDRSDDEIFQCDECGKII